MSQPHLGPPGDVADRRRLPLLTLLQTTADACWVAVVPRGLDQQTSDLAVAGLGNLAKSTLLAAGVLAGHQSDVAHQVARMGEALELSEFCHQTDGGNLVDGPQSHQCSYQRLHPP